MNERYIISYLSKTKKRSAKFIENELKEYGIDDLIPSHGSILSVLYGTDRKLTMKEISKFIGKDKSTVTPLVNKLLALGYIQKEKSEDDKRVTYISLTEKGKGIESIFRSISDKLLETVYKDFTEQEKNTFLLLLKKLYDNLK